MRQRRRLHRLGKESLGGKLRTVLLFAAAGLLCAHPARASDASSIAGLTRALVSLSPEVDPAEAALVAETAHESARQLARQYRVVGPSIFQNFLVHIGARDRGYCFHWAHDIGAQLRRLHLKTLDLHWGAAEPGTRSEHNCIVVTAHRQPFEMGYIIDGWRHAGRLFWWQVMKDDHPWKEDLAETAALHRPR